MCLSHLVDGSAIFCQGEEWKSRSVVEGGEEEEKKIITLPSEGSYRQTLDSGPRRRKGGGHRSWGLLNPCVHSHGLDIGFNGLVGSILLLSFPFLVPLCSG